MLFYIIHSLFVSVFFFFSFEEFRGVNNMRSYAEKRIKGSKGGIGRHRGVYRQGLECGNSFESRLRQRALVGSTARTALDSFLEPGSTTATSCAREGVSGRGGSTTQQDGGDGKARSMD